MADPRPDGGELREQIAAVLASDEPDRLARAREVMAARGLPTTSSAVFAAAVGLPIPEPATDAELEQLREDGRRVDAAAAALYGRAPG
jgi:hypothetical protein